MALHLSKMKKVVIYSKEICPYCVRAKALLSRKNVAFEEIKISDEVTRNEMIKKSGGRLTVPQIFIDDVHIGGCDDLYELESQKKLDALL
jgi:glutaredoxin 3